MQLNRREAIIKMALLLGATTVGPRLQAGEFGKTAPAATGFSPEEIALLDEIGDTIVPPTEVPGAKAVGIGAFIAMMIHDCYSPADQAACKAGLEKLARDYRATYGEDFVGGAAERRTAFLNALDREQRRQRGKNLPAQKIDTAQAAESGLNEAERPDRPHYFRVLKELALLGYFTSEFAQTKLLGYLEVPGRYDGDVPYTPSTAIRA